MSFQSCSLIRFVRFPNTIKKHKAKLKKGNDVNKF